MLKSRSVTIGFLLVALTLNTTVGCTVGEVSVISQSAAEAVVGQVTVRALPQAQVTLTAGQSTVSWDERTPDGEPFELPLLYLHREREAAAHTDRTLTIHISGLEGGAEVELEAESRHVNVATGERHRETARTLLPDRPCTADDPCAIRWTFDVRTMLSDLYTLRVKDSTGDLLWENPHSDRPDFAALDTWEVGVDGYTVRVSYAALFPFVRGQEDIGERLPPAAVPDLIEQQFVPTIVETWHTQFNAWGFGPIHPDWDADKVVEIYITYSPFALFGGTGIYTISRHPDGSPYPERRLWWFSSSPAYDAYDSLENGYQAVFAHEFFHLVQWNALLSAGCSTHRWSNLFIEAQGKFVPSVQYPEMEILGEHIAGVGSNYQSAARHFLAHSLNVPLGDLEADTAHRYDWALYWRFLYEQFGGMGIVRAALEEMACRYDPDVEAALPAVMDAAMARSDGPFQTFEQSLIAFAEANYALRLDPESGRCATENLAECGNRYYDPNHTYKAPPLEDELRYSGSPVTYDGSVPATFGTDLIEVRLDRDLDGRPLRITFRGEGRFSVQIWTLDGEANASVGGVALASDTGDGGGQIRALTPYPEAMAKDDGNLYIESFPHLDTQKCDGLALIVVRLDTDTGMDATGNYIVTLDSTSGSSDEG
jgi:hypothetical protein